MEPRRALASSIRFVTLAAASLVVLLGVVGPAALPAAAQDARPRAAIEADLAAREAAHGADALSLAELLDELVGAALDAGDLAASRDAAVRSAEIRAQHAAGPSADVAIGWHEAGLAHHRLEQYEEAYAALARAVAEWEAVEAAAPGSAEPYDLVWARSDLAEMSRLTARWAESEEQLRAGIELARAAGVSDYLPVLLNNLGTLLNDQNRLHEGEPLLRESLALKSRDANVAPLTLARGHLNFGVMLRTQHRYVPAEVELRQALRLARAELPAGDRRLLSFLNGLAGVYSRTGRGERALPLRAEALEIIDSLDAKPRALWADILQATGRDLLSLDRAAEAAERFRASRDLRRALFGDEHPAVGVATLELATALAAQSGFADAEVGRTAREAATLLDGTPVFREEWARAMALRARNLRAAAAGNAATRTVARQLLGRATDLLLDIRAQRGGTDRSRADFAAQYRREADTLVAWLVQDGEPALALAEAERVRNRLFAEQLAAARLDVGDAPADVRERIESRQRSAEVRVNETRRRMRAVAASSRLEEVDREERLAALDAELVAALEEAVGAEAELRLYSPRYAVMLAVSENEAPLPDARPGETVLAYHLGAERSFAFVRSAGAATQVFELTTPDGYPVSAGGLAGRWEELAKRLRPRWGDHLLRGVVTTSRLNEPEPAPVEADLADFARLVLPPSLRAALPSTGALRIVPDAALHSVPFEALVLEGRTREDAVYGLDALPPIRYSNSIRPVVGRPSVRGDGEVLVVSDPEFASLPALASAREEARAVAEAFAPREVRSLTGADAHEAAVRAELERAEWIHFATHGVLHEGVDGRLAALALAAPTAASHHDGYLHLYEVYGLALDCELAFLNACDTSAGPVVAGESAFALSRGFLVAGARHVVAGLWPLHDRAAADLARAFFARVAGAEGEAPSYAEALRDAKKEVRQRFPDPRHWAPFVLLDGGATAD